MPVNYTTVFTKIGKIIGRSNSLAALAATTLAADLQAIIATYGTGTTSFGTAQGPISGLTGTYEGFQNAVTGWRQGLNPFVQRTLTDVDTVVSQLVGLKQTDINSVLHELLVDMNDNAQTVNGNDVTLGTVTAGAGNVGNGTALVDKYLDGFNVPVRGAFASIEYNGIYSELSVPSETMELVCTSDSFSGGGSEGQEQWSWTGGLAYPAFDYHSEGSGQGPGLTTAHGDSTIANLNFENFTSNTPSGFTITSGTAGLHVWSETTLAKVYRGSKALRLTGDGATTITLTQSVSPSALRSRRRYLFTVRMFRDGPGPGGTARVNIQFTGTGYTASGSEQIDILASTLTGSYVLHHFYLTMPATLPSDLKLQIQANGSLGSGCNVYLDSASFSPVVYHGGVNCQVVSGSTPWTVGDRLTFTVANTTTGLFQNYFRRAFGVQLPSNLVGGETITDSLAA